MEDARRIGAAVCHRDGVVNNPLSRFSLSLSFSLFSLFVFCSWDRGGEGGGVVGPLVVTAATESEVGEQHGAALRRRTVMRSQPARRADAGRRSIHISPSLAMLPESVRRGAIRRRCLKLGDG